MSILRQFDIHWGNFSSARGHEQHGRRPVLIVSTDQFNAIPNGLVIIMPITKVHRPVPTCVPLPKKGTGLAEQSFCLVDQIRTISMERLNGHIGSLTDIGTRDRIQTALQRILGLN